MEYVDGVPLSSLWYKMSQPTKKRVILQLKDYLTQLRSLKPPSEGVISSVSGGPLRDQPRVGVNPFGPFSNHNDFHRFLRAGYEAEAFSALPGGCELINSHNQRYQTKLTHGDFAPRNIMVKMDGTVTAIVDWDCAGWFPEYWEYTKAKFTPKAQADWISSIGEMTGVYHEQFIGECKVQDFCGIMLTS